MSLAVAQPTHHRQTPSRSVPQRQNHGSGNPETRLFNSSGYARASGGTSDTTDLGQKADLNVRNLAYYDCGLLPSGLGRQGQLGPRMTQSGLRNGSQTWPSRKADRRLRPSTPPTDLPAPDIVLAILDASAERADACRDPGKRPARMG
jgi:hypothetical protein